MSELLDMIKTRRSIRKYKSDMVPKEIIDKIVEAGTYAATGMGQQSPIILAVTNKEVRDKLSKWNADIMGTDTDPFYGAPVVLVVLADKNRPTAVYDGSLVMANLMLEAHDLGIGSCWIHRAKEEFESVIMKYFNIDSETLQSKTIYDSENLTYEYKPRGFEEVEYPEYPYSEVVDFTENSDGTITLTANVVFPYAGDSKVYAHEVVVRPLENGRVQYVSNRIIPSEDNYRETWHTPRLTLEEWEELYGGE